MTKPANKMHKSSSQLRIHQIRQTTQMQEEGQLRDNNSNLPAIVNTQPNLASSNLQHEFRSTTKGGGMIQIKSKNNLNAQHVQQQPQHSTMTHWGEWPPVRSGKGKSQNCQTRPAMDKNIRQTVYDLRERIN